jgi:hypothetical protein
LTYWFQQQQQQQTVQRCVNPGCDGGASVNVGGGPSYAVGTGTIYWLDFDAGQILRATLPP